MSNDTVKLANDSYQKGYISKDELATVLHREGVISDAELAQVSDTKPSSLPESFGQKAYNFSQETLPYLAGAAGGIGGATAGGPLGVATGPVAAGLAYGGAKSGLRGIGRLMGYEKPSTLGQEMKQTALQDIPIGTAMEGTPLAVKNAVSSPIAKKLGNGIADIVSTIPGVESEQVTRLFKNPRSILPSWLGGPPALKETGNKLGQLQSKYGLSSIEERGGEEILKAKMPRALSEDTVKIFNPDRAYNIDTLEKMKQGMTGDRLAQTEKAIAELKQLSSSATSKETDRQVAARVFNEMKTGQLPDLDTTKRAIAGIDNRLEGMAQDLTTAESQNKMLLTKTRQKLVNHLSEMAPDLAEQRRNYAMGKTREAFTQPGFGLMAQSGGGTAISKMGANRLVGPYALYRMARDPVFGAVLAATQSPAVLGTGTALAGGATKGLQNRVGAYIINALLKKSKLGKPQGDATQ